MFSDEESKAVQETAKLGQKAIDLTGDAGGFFTKTFGSAIDQYSQAISDKAAAYRIKNLLSTINKTRKYIKELGFSETFSIEYRNGQLFLEAISEEPEETVQIAWAKYLTNCINPKNRTISAQRVLIDIIRKMEPVDLEIISEIPLEILLEKRADAYIIKSENLPIDDQRVIESLSRLSGLGLFTYDYSADRLILNPTPHPCQLIIVTSVGEFIATPLLMILKNAITITASAPDIK